MRSVVVYESMFGNTRRAAELVSEAMHAAGVESRAIDVRDADATAVAGCDLVVLGAPTHAFSLSRPATRADAVKQGADPARALMGLREWLSRLDEAYPPGSRRPAAAVFDTRVDKVRRLPGSAARRAGRTLRSRGFALAAAPVSFYVDDVAGPFTSGETDRARAWGASLAGALARDAS